MDEIAIPRTRSSDQTRQVFVEGIWHRTFPDLSATACNVTYHSQFCPTRFYVLEGDLCPTCFTEPEIDRARRLAQQEKEITT